MRLHAIGLLAAAGALTLGVLVALDGTRLEDEIPACGLWDAPFFEAFGPCDAQGARLSGPDTTIVLRGLGPREEVALSLALASALRRPQAVTATANGLIVKREDLGGRPGVWDLAAHADAQGVVRLRLLPEEPTMRASVRVYWIRVSQQGAALPAPRTWLWYAMLLLIAIGFERWASAGTRMGWLGLMVVGAGLAVVLMCSRLQLAAQQPWLSTGLAGVLGMAALAGRCVSRPTAAALALAFGVRVLLALHPGFPGVDVDFHAHNIARFQQGEVLQSRITDPGGAGLLPIPYPPLLYALLAPFAGSGVIAVRVAMLVLEGTAPLLVFQLLRAGDASPRASELAAVASAVMPEGLLVLAKGVAANILGAWWTLPALAVLLGGGRGWLVALLCTLAFLSHPGAAGALVGLLVLWAALGRGRPPCTPQALGLAALGAALAFLVYYRDVAGLTLESLRSLGSQASEGASGFFHLRLVHLGKIFQDLLLKFGAGPVVLAVVGLRHAPPRLAPLLRAWLLGAAVLAGLAVFTPFALRFEYFVAPALCAAAGLGAERLLSEGRRVLVYACLGCAFLVQVVLGALLLADRFDIINVVIPSPRWPLIS